MANLKCEFCRERNETVETISICESCFYTRGKWISVKDMLPEDEEGKGKEVLVYTPDEVIYGIGIFVAYYIGDGRFQTKEEFYPLYPDEDFESVTHWMPLPTPPESENGDE